MGLGAGASVLLVLPEGNRLCYALHLYFQASNNVA
jgi:hypothetical protein